ncbi:hypothetical protein [Halolactibacillus sp. JCM 19043]|uniref:hypothetical protein n=1 Tax=Halolactibacillus sp. JCM 19043 TaxID=1460638 RepID=UPI0007859313|nr:hypothetical protein [Halolactibacillus sp. JCM 19043]
MRLGGYVFVDHLTPETWVNKHLEKGFNSAVLPINHTSSQTERNDYVSLAKEHDILLSEVGAWSNPISSDLETRKKAIDYIKNNSPLVMRLARGRVSTLPVLSAQLGTVQTANITPNKHSN